MNQLHNIWNTINSWVTYLWATITAGTALLALQDYTFIVGTVIGAIYTIRTFRVNRAEKLASIADMKRRTDLYADYLKKTNPGKPHAAVEIVHDALQRASNNYE